MQSMLSVVGKTPKSFQLCILKFQEISESSGKQAEKQTKDEQGSQIPAASGNSQAPNFWHLPPDRNDLLVRWQN